MAMLAGARSSPGAIFMPAMYKMHDVHGTREAKKDYNTLMPVILFYA